MDKILLRYAESSDIDDIISVWRQSFGDDEQFIRNFFELPGILSTTVVAHYNGHVRSFMTAFDGASVNGKKTSYAYALCTHPQFRGRGLGASVLKKTIELCFLRGAHAVTLRPADASLAKTYITRFGGAALSFLREKSFIAGACRKADVKLITAKEYLSFCGGEIEMPESQIRAQELINRYCASYFCLVDGLEKAACLLERRENIYVVKELYPLSAGDGVLSALCAYLGTDALMVQHSSPQEDGSLRPSVICFMKDAREPCYYKQSSPFFYLD